MNDPYEAGYFQGRLARRHNTPIIAIKHDPDEYRRGFIAGTNALLDELFDERYTRVTAKAASDAVKADAKAASDAVKATAKATAKAESDAVKATAKSAKQEELEAETAAFRARLEDPIANMVIR